MDYQQHTSDTDSLHLSTAAGGSPNTAQAAKAPGIKSIVLILLVVAVVGAVVIGGVCGAGKCSGSSGPNARSKNDGSGFVFVRGTVYEASGQVYGAPLSTATVYDYQGNPVNTSSDGSFSLWARAVNGVAALRVTAPNYLPFILSIPYNNYTMPTVNAAIRLLADTYLSSLTVTCNTSWDGVANLKVRFNYDHDLQVRGLNHPSLDGKTLKIRAMIMNPFIFAVPGQLKTPTGELLSTVGTFFYFDIIDVSTNQSIIVPPTVNATFWDTKLQTPDVPNAGPWKMYRLESSGRWNATSLLPADPPLYSTLVFNLSGPGYWSMARTVPSYCSRAGVMLDNGKPCQGGMVLYQDTATNAMGGTIHSIAYTESDGSFCMEGMGQPYYGVGFTTLGSIVQGSGATTFNFDNSVTGTCGDVEDHCKDLPPIQVSASSPDSLSMCMQPSVPPSHGSFGSF